MADQKIFAGHGVRRLRRSLALTQVAMAESLDISASYLNLIERNQRPLTAAIIMKMVAIYDFDPRTLTHDEPGGGEEALRRRLSHPIFADISIDRTQMQEWMAAAPDSAKAFAILYDAYIAAPQSVSKEPLKPEPVRQEIERWNGYFADLDILAEKLADELRLSSNDLYNAVSERLRTKHQIVVRILPYDVMPNLLQRLDLHARQLQISETLAASGRLFALCYQLAQMESSDAIDNMVKGAGFDDRVSQRLFRRHLTSYYAAAIIMPYSRFLRACESSGYDLYVLQHRFGASFEMIAHRLTTLQRIGSRGLPFFMLRIDRSGQVSKRYAGASKSPLIEGDQRCPMWNIHDANKRPGRILTQLIELEDGSKWFTMACSVHKNDRVMTQSNHDENSVEFTIVIGLKAEFAKKMTITAGRDFESGNNALIGLGCTRCTRHDCAQRAQAPSDKILVFNERERAVTPFSFARD